LELITTAFPKLGAQEAVHSFAFYMSKLDVHKSHLMRRVSTNPARSMVWWNMLTHAGLIQHTRHANLEEKRLNKGPLAIATGDVVDDIGQCACMLESGNTIRHKKIHSMNIFSKNQFV